MKTFEPNPVIAEDIIKDELEKKYGFENLNCHLIYNIRNIIYLIEEEASNYIFKVFDSNSRDLEEIAGEVEFLDLLHKKNAQVSYPISDIHGNFLQDIITDEGILHGVLYSFAQGEQNNDMNEEQLVNAGRELAIIHHLASGLELKYQLKEFTLNTITTEALEALRPVFEHNKAEYDYLNELSKLVLNKFELFNLPESAKGYCHNDFGPNNFHFQEDNSITIFDFDQMGKGFFILDIASMYNYYFSMIQGGKFSFDEGAKAFDLFITSYSTIRQLSEVEIQVIPYFCYGAIMTSLKFKCEYQIELVQPRYLTDYIELLNRLVYMNILPA